MKSTEADYTWPPWLSYVRRSPMVWVLLVWGILFLGLGIWLALLN
jgi:hypothetical protein